MKHFRLYPPVLDANVLLSLYMDITPVCTQIKYCLRTDSSREGPICSAPFGQ